jgi:hypothetical protein
MGTREYIESKIQDTHKGEDVTGVHWGGEYKSGTTSPTGNETRTAVVEVLGKARTFLRIVGRPHGAGENQLGWQDSLALSVEFDGPY